MIKKKKKWALRSFGSADYSPPYQIPDPPLIGWENHRRDLSKVVTFKLARFSIPSIIFLRTKLKKALMKKFGNRWHKT